MVAADPKLVAGAEVALLFALYSSLRFFVSANITSLFCIAFVNSSAVKTFSSPKSYGSLAVPVITHSLTFLSKVLTEDSPNAESSFTSVTIVEQLIFPHTFVITVLAPVTPKSSNYFISSYCLTVNFIGKLSFIKLHIAHFTVI